MASAAQRTAHPDGRWCQGRDPRRHGQRFRLLQEALVNSFTRQSGHVRMHQHISPADSADVIVLGAGPAGSATAFHLAQAGLDVLLLEKSQFPREKVCGDGLTPRAVKQLVGMGIPLNAEDGWFPNKGLRIIGGGVRLELDWPELAAYPGYGLMRSRRGFDETLARAAAKAGARLLEGVSVTGPVLDEKTGRITGVTARAGADGAGADGAGAPRTYHARVVVAADGNSSRLSL